MSNTNTNTTEVAVEVITAPLEVVFAAAARLRAGETVFAVAKSLHTGGMPVREAVVALRAARIFNSVA